MEAGIKPYYKNKYPLRGLLIKSSSPVHWLQEMERMQLHPGEHPVYPVPGPTPNSVWGCLVFTKEPVNTTIAARNECCQLVFPNVFIPEKTILHPLITSEEAARIFTPNLHLFHPEIGLAELEAPVHWESLLAETPPATVQLNRPEPAVFVPAQINRFYIQPVSSEEVLKNMEENLFPQKETRKDKPLNIGEKVKLRFYKLLYKKDHNEQGEPAETRQKNWWNKFTSLLGLRGGKPGKWEQNMQQDFDQLEERNRKELDKLFDLLKKNPAEALKYAIPLDADGSGRGPVQPGSFSMEKRWFNFSLFGNSGFGGGGGSVDLGDDYFKLQEQYQNTAKRLIEQQQYKEAAFVYMKLLKEYTSAAETLKQGKLYAEAATVYLKYANDKKAAAECYEQGSMLNEAIALYKELNEHEKAGDLYHAMNQHLHANECYQLAVDNYAGKNQFVKAAVVCRFKMNNLPAAQEQLLQGWRSNRDNVNCLSLYFSYIDNLADRKTAIYNIYRNEVSETNRGEFLRVLRKEYAGKNSLSEEVRELAYQVISLEITKNPGIVSELKEFNNPDKELLKDALRYRLTHKLH